MPIRTANHLPLRETAPSRRRFAYWGVLRAGWATAISHYELAAETRASATTIRDQIQALVDRGPVQRIDNAEDGRSYFVTLTAEGERNLERGRVASERAEQRLARAYGEKEALRRELLRFISSAP